MRLRDAASANRLNPKATDFRFGTSSKRFGTDKVAVMQNSVAYAEILLPTVTRKPWKVSWWQNYCVAVGKLSFSADCTAFMSCQQADHGPLPWAS